MIIDDNTAQMITDLEYIVGSNVYNNGLRFWYDKYPVYCQVNYNHVKEYKFAKCHKINYIDPDYLDSIHYVFGSNELYIGNGLMKVLDYLEKTFNLDFSELEKPYVKQRINKMNELVDILNSGNSISLKSDLYTIGIDLPEGRYLLYNLEKFSEIKVLNEEYVCILRIKEEHNYSFLLQYKNLIKKSPVAIELKKGYKLFISYGSCDIKPI